MVNIAMQTVQIAGLGEVKIPADIQFRQALIPVGQTNQRPGLPMAGGKASFWIQHETGNEKPGADAEGHSRYMDDGAMARDTFGNLFSQLLGYHFTVDDHEIIQKIPVNEVSWQAADGPGPGNMDSVSCEACVNSDGDENRMRRNAEFLAAAVCRGLGLGREQITRHWDRNGHQPPDERHHCPDHMMNDNFWDTFVLHVHQLIQDPDLGVFPAPDFFDLEKWDGTDRTLPDGTVLFACNRVITAKRRTKRYRFADPAAESIGPDLKKGETAEIQYVFKTQPGGVRWAYTSFGTRLRLAHFEPFIKVAPQG